MEALSRETLENMMEQAVAKATTVSFWPQGEAPGAKNSDAVFTPEHLSMIVRSPVFAPRKLPFMPPQNLTA